MSAGNSGFMAPRVSVLMTIYNAGPYLRPALESLRRQTLSNFELVAVQNGSNDGSEAVIREFAADPRVKLIDLKENVGRVPALNLAVQAARGDYLAILDADDIAHPRRFEAQVGLLDARSEIMMVSSFVRTIDEDGQVTGHHAVPTDSKLLRDCLAYTNPFWHSSCTFRREDAIAAGGHDRRYPTANDLCLWIGLSQRGELAVIPEELADIRQHASNMTNASPYAISRFYEELDLYKLAQSLPGISAEARRRSQIAIARLHFNIAKRFLDAHRPLRAMAELGKSVASAPAFVAQQLAARGGLTMRSVAS